jgi:hypothetical protein
MRAINKQLTILSETERDALYELPDFDEAQRVHFLQFTESEQDLIYARKSWFCRKVLHLDKQLINKLFFSGVGSYATKLSALCD